MTLKATRILVVEDDLDLNALVKYNLEQNKNFTVKCLFDGALAQTTIDDFKPDLIVLDVMLPGNTGTEILKNLRKSTEHRELPIILLTARSHEADRIEGLQLGADDYITKPFSPKELVLRIEAVLRRTQRQLENINTDVHATFKIGPLEIDKHEQCVLVNNKPISLTVIEFGLLNYLASRLGRLSSREILLKDVWKYEGNVNTRTVDTHIKRLRQKLGDAGHLIETQHGYGYKLSNPEVMA